MSDQIAPFPVGYSKREGASVSASDISTAKKAYMAEAHVYGTLAADVMASSKSVTKDSMTVSSKHIKAGTTAFVAPAADCTAVGIRVKSVQAATDSAEGTVTFQEVDASGAEVDPPTFTGSAKVVLVS